jgi:hypothetical protein
MATRSKPNWKLLDRLLPIFEKEGWSHAQIADDWGMSLAILEGHLIQEIGMPVPSKHDYPTLFEEYDQRLANGESPKEIRRTFESRGVNWGTYQNRRSQWNKAHRSTPEAHQSTPEEPDLSMVHSGTPEHPSTPEVHPELSPSHSSAVHSGVPARQEWHAEVPAVHPGTPTAEDWELWNIIKARWLEVEKMLAERHIRQALLSTPTGIPRHTVKKTYVVDTFYVELIDRYAKEHSLDLKDVLNFAFHRFFEQEGYLRE